MFLSLHFQFFVLGLVHYISFTLVLCVSDVWVCLLSVGVVESFFFFSISFLFQKDPKIFAYLHHYAFHFCIWHGICTRFLFQVLVRTSYRNDCTYHLKKFFAFHVVPYPIFIGHNAFALIVRCAFYFKLRHNTIGCTVIYPFWVIKPNKINLN